VILAAGVVLFSAFKLFGNGILGIYYESASKAAASSGDVLRSADFLFEKLKSRPKDEALRLRVCQKYLDAGNTSRAEYVLFSGIEEAGQSTVLYAKLSQVYVLQDKLRDAVELLDGIQMPNIAAEIAAIRPPRPSFARQPGTYNEMIPLELDAQGQTIYYSIDGEIPSTEKEFIKRVDLSPGKNKVMAVAVNQQGLVSAWSEGEYVLKDIVLPYYCKDPEIEKLIRQTIKKPDGYLYTSDLWKIKTLKSSKKANFKTLDDLLECTGLTTLELQGTNQSCDISVLAEVPMLQTIRLQHMGVSSLDLEALKGLSDLKTLDLSYNAIGNLDALPAISGLVSLNLTGNSILEATQLSSLKNLTNLNLTQNALSDTTPIGKLINLKSLNLSENRLSYLNGLSALPELESLDVSRNPLLTSLDGVFRLPRLKTLIASNCGLESLPKASNISLPKLQSLDITGNKVGNIKGLSKAGDLVELKIAQNRVPDLKALEKMNKLRTLDADKNKISSVSPLKNLSSLSVLRVENNSITTLLPLKGCPSLREVFAFGNSIKDPADAFAGSNIKVFRT